MAGRRVRGIPLGWQRGEAGELVPDELELAAMRCAHVLRERGQTWETVANCLSALGFVGRGGQPYTALSARMLAQRYEEMERRE